MGLRDLIASGVALADNLTGDLQPEVSHEAWVGQNGFAQAIYSAPSYHKALVERKQRLVRTASGEEKVASHLVTFLRPLPANGASGRNEPIDPRDRITLADGTTAPILALSAFDDRATNQGYFYQVWLG